VVGEGRAIGRACDKRLGAVSHRLTVCPGAVLPSTPGPSPRRTEHSARAAKPPIRRSGHLGHLEEGKSAKNRFHPDFLAADLDAEVTRLVGLGAHMHSEHTEHELRWVTLTDPEGNEFDVIAQPSAG
jgi:hypothetical protein